MLLSTKISSLKFMSIPRGFTEPKAAKRSHHVVSKTQAATIPKECSSNSFLFLFFICKIPLKNSYRIQAEKIKTASKNSHFFTYLE